MSGGLFSERGFRPLPCMLRDARPGVVRFAYEIYVRAPVPAPGRLRSLGSSSTWSAPLLRPGVLQSRYPYPDAAG